MISLGLILAEFKDAIKEGDGTGAFVFGNFFFYYLKHLIEQTMQWKPLTYLLKYHIVLPPRLAEGLKWSRFVKGTMLVVIFTSPNFLIFTWNIIMNKQAVGKW